MINVYSGSITIDSSLSLSTKLEINKLIQEAIDENLPAELLERKVAEGVAKQKSEAMIINAVANRLENLRNIHKVSQGGKIDKRLFLQEKSLPEKTGVSEDKTVVKYSNKQEPSENVILKSSKTPLLQNRNPSPPIDGKTHKKESKVISSSHSDKGQSEMAGEGVDKKIEKANMKMDKSQKLLEKKQLILEKKLQALEKKLEKRNQK